MLSKLGIIPNLKERFMNNYSKQREIILEVIKNNPIHPTAEEIYGLVTKKEPKISKSTVYRNINILVENGIIQKITISSKPDRYDYLYKEHNHLICNNCGKVLDFVYDIEKPKIENEIKNQLKQEFKISNVSIYGICEDCKSKIKN